MAELTKHQRQALGIFKMAWGMRQEYLDRQATMAASRRLPTFRERADVDAAFEDGCAAVLQFERGTIREPDGTVVQVTFDRPDAGSIGAKMAELRASLPVEKLPLWDEVFGPPA